MELPEVSDDSDVFWGAGVAWARADDNCIEGGEVGKQSGEFAEGLVDVYGVDLSAGASRELVYQVVGE